LDVGQNTAASLVLKSDEVLDLAGASGANACHDERLDLQDPAAVPGLGWTTGTFVMGFCMHGLGTSEERVGEITGGEDFTYGEDDDRDSGEKPSRSARRGGKL
jgi:hypothetical protein